MPENIFDLATKEFGGRLNYARNMIEANRSRGLNFLEIYGKDTRLIKKFPFVIFDFVDNEHVNAFAFKYDDKYIIGINESVKLILFDLFNRMLSHREILKNIGDPSQEIDFGPVINNYFSNVESLVVCGCNGVYEAIVPINKERHAYADMLTTIAMDFIFEHELSHVLNGHVDYVKETLGINVVSEFHKMSVENSYLLDLQTLEMDADCTAIARCCNFAIEAVKNPQLVHPAYRPFYMDYYNAIADIFFAINNMLKLFGYEDYKNLQIGKSSHPDIAIRQLMVSMQFEAIANQRPELDYMYLEDLISKKFIESERAFELITGKKINKEVFDPKFYAFHPLPKALESNWKNNIREKLLKHKYKPLAI